MSLLLPPPGAPFPSHCSQDQPILPDPGWILLPPKSPFVPPQCQDRLPPPTAPTILPDCKWACDLSSSDLAPAEKVVGRRAILHGLSSLRPLWVSTPLLCKMDRQRWCRVPLVAPGITVLGEASSKIGSGGTTRMRSMGISMETSAPKLNFPHFDSLGTPSPN